MSAKTETAKSDIVQYLNEWSGGEFMSRTTERDGLERRVAENVVAYHSLTFWAVPDYTAEVERMIRRGDLKVFPDGSGEWVVATEA